MQTGRQIGRLAYRQVSGRQAGMADRQTDNRKASGRKAGMSDRQTVRQEGRQADRQTGRQASRLTDWHADKPWAVR